METGRREEEITNATRRGREKGDDRTAKRVEQKRERERERNDGKEERFLLTTFSDRSERGFGFQSTHSPLPLPLFPTTTSGGLVK